MEKTAARPSGTLQNGTGWVEGVVAGVRCGAVDDRHGHHCSDEKDVKNDGNNGEEADTGGAAGNHRVDASVGLVEDWSVWGGDGRGGEGMYHGDGTNYEGRDISPAEVVACREVGERSSDDGCAAEGEDVESDQHQAQKSALDRHFAGSYWGIDWEVKGVGEER